MPLPNRVATTRHSLGTSPSARMLHLVDEHGVDTAVLLDEFSVTSAVVSSRRTHRARGLAQPVLPDATQGGVCSSSGTPETRRDLARTRSTRPTPTARTSGFVARSDRSGPTSTTKTVVGRPPVRSDPSRSGCTAASRARLRWFWSRSHNGTRGGTLTSHLCRTAEPKRCSYGKDKRVRGEVRPFWSCSHHQNGGGTTPSPLEPVEKRVHRRLRWWEGPSPTVAPATAARAGVVSSTSR
jgi:hypothetical protein